MQKPAACTAIRKVWQLVVSFPITAVLQVASALIMAAPTSEQPMHDVSFPQGSPASPDAAELELPLEEPLLEPLLELVLLPLLPLLVELPLPLPLEDPDDPLPDPLPEDEPASSPLPLPDEPPLDPKPVPPPPPLPHPARSNKPPARIAILRIRILRGGEYVRTSSAEQRASAYALVTRTLQGWPAPRVARRCTRSGRPCLSFARPSSQRWTVRPGAPTQ